VAKPGLSVLSVASEVFPLIKTGGLADVAGALPGALAREGVGVVTLLPGYPAVLARLGRATAARALPDLFGAPATLVAGKADGLDLIAIDAPHLYARDGNPYLGPDGRDFPDNDRRFAALGAVGALLAREGAGGRTFDVLHAHDWQAGLAPAYLAYADGPTPPSVFTVHNLAFQGRFEGLSLAALGLPARAGGIDGVMHHGAVSTLKAGLQLASHVTTVSPTYADEIRTPEHGMGFDGLLRWRGAAVSGILNGIDTDAWNPATDALISATYDAEHLARRDKNAAALGRALGLAPEPGPIVGVVSRLSWQKGLDLLLEALPGVIARGASLALLGAGERALEDAFRAAAERYPGRVGVRVGYDEGLAHLIQAGSDVLVVPSRFEPCGLTQLCALRYGAVPVVAATGGLVDTVTDLSAGTDATGVVFSPVDAASLARALDTALDLHANRRAFRRLQRRGMSRDVSWAAPAAAYAALYRRLIAA
jgi:starch synthase